MYLKREIEDVINRALGQFKCVLITGSRQTGKTTLLKHLLEDDYNYYTLDDYSMLVSAKSDPSKIVNDAKIPFIIDEVQKCPELFSQVKYVIDKSDKEGQVVLTGSQTYELMKGVSESLAGRICIIKLMPLSLREIEHLSKKCAFIPVKFTEDSNVSALDLERIWEIIQRGSMPRLNARLDVDWNLYYSSYVQTYIERDVRQLISLKDETNFYRFMVACAARSGQLLNNSDIADTVGVSVKTVENWLSILSASGIIHILQPFYSNANKRLSKTAKLYFLDTGLMCYLTSWNTHDQAKCGAASGYIYETFVVSEIIKSHANQGFDLRNIYFYRDGRKREIDLVIQNGHTLHPIEIKTKSTVTSSDIKNFKCLSELSGYEVGPGNVICQTEHAYGVDENVEAISPYSI